jgi:muramoyltetrapeptide carboxypeptidase
MRIVKPKRLSKGDTIGVISPASSPDESIRIETGVRYLEKQGFRVKVAKNVGKNHGYLAGTDDERLEDLHSMFKDKNVKAIFCIRGGYGAFRFIDKIDYKLIRQNPKIFAGYSEITALQTAIFQKTGLVTFGGPMVAVDFWNEVNSYTEEMFWKVTTTNKKLGRIDLPDEYSDSLPNLNRGLASGRILGGNLAVFTALVGTEYFPSLKDRILMLEDINEKPYKVDRLLNQLRLAKVFKQVNGIILGRFVECYEPDPNTKTLSLGEVIDHYIRELKIPVIYTFPHGHIKEFVTIPFGITVKMNATKGFVEYTEGAVT